MKVLSILPTGTTHLADVESTVIVNDDAVDAAKARFAAIDPGKFFTVRVADVDTLNDAIDYIAGVLSENAAER